MARMTLLLIGVLAGLQHQLSFANEFAPLIPRCATAEKFAALRSQPQFNNTATDNNRPVAIGFLDSASHPLRVHYQAGVELSYVESILAIAEISWQALFTAMAFRAPHSDGELGGDQRFDFYIVTDLAPNIGGYTGFSGFFETTPEQDAFGYIVIANNIDMRIRRSVVAHELSHASQIAYDWWEHLSFMEGTSVWASDRVFPDENMVWRYFTFFNAEPNRSLSYVSIAAPYQYGTGMWVRYLDERFGSDDGQLIRRIWESTGQLDYDNEPDFLDTIETSLADVPLNEVFADFGAWRTFVGQRNDGRHFRDAAQWYGWNRPLEPTLELNLSTGVSEVSGHSAQPVHQLGQAMFAFGRANAEPWQLTISPTEPAFGRYILDTYVRVGTEPWQRVERHDCLGDCTVRSMPNSPATTQWVAVLSRFGNEKFDPDTVAWTEGTFNYRFQPPDGTVAAKPLR